METPLDIWARSDNTLNPKRTEKIVASPPPRSVGIGIDIGMTYTGAAIYYRSANGVLRVETVPAPEPGRPRFPSRVFIGAQGRIEVGDRVWEHYQGGADRIFQLFKRDIGAGSGRTIAGTTVTAEFLTTKVIEEIGRHIKTHLQLRGLDQAPQIHYTFTYPGMWKEPKKRAFNEAIKAAGFTPDVYTLLEEPVATALDAAGVGQMGYGSRGPGEVLICDLGGGTLDLAVVTRRTNGTVFMRAANGGDSQLGMSNIDKLLVLYIYSCAGMPLTDRIKDVVNRKVVRGANLDLALGDMAGDNKDIEEILETVEQLKKTIVQQWRGPQSKWPVYYNGSVVTIPREYISAVFDNMNDWVRKAVQSYLNELSQKHGIENGEITRIIVGGGGSNLPDLNETLNSLLPASIDRLADGADSMVQRGAALFALKPEILRERRCNASFGVKTYVEMKPGEHAYTHLEEVKRDDGQKVRYRAAYKVFLAKGQVIPPNSVVHSFCPLRDDQTAVSFEILQGEDADPDKNQNKGTARVSLPSGSDHTYEVLCKFSLGPDGLIHAFAYDPNHSENVSEEIMFQWDQDVLQE